MSELSIEGPISYVNANGENLPEADINIGWI